MHFAVIVPKKLVVCVQNAEKEIRHLKKLPWAMFIYVLMVEAGLYSPRVLIP